MQTMLQYSFMQKALIVGLLLAIIIPCIGVVVVLKRLSMVGDALSHTSLAGVAIGLAMGVNPILGAVVACTVAAFSIEFIRKKIPKYSEISIAVIMSAGVGIAAIMSGLVPNSANFSSFLFGSIVAISDFELYMVIGISCVVIVMFILLYKEIMFIVFDESAAKLAGVPVKIVNFLITILTAITVSVASRSVGALIVSSMLVIPVACSMQLSKSYKQTVIFAILFDVVFTIVGLTISFYRGLKPGGTIVLTGVVVLIALIIVKSLVDGARRRS